MVAVQRTAARSWNWLTLLCGEVEWNGLIWTLVMGPVYRTDVLGTGSGSNAGKRMDTLQMQLWPGSVPKDATAAV